MTSLSLLYDRPIRRPRRKATTLAYRGVPVELNRPEAAEPLVDVATLSIPADSYYARTDGLNAPYYRSFPSASPRVFCRASVAAKLAVISQRLRSHGIELLLWDGFRPISCQVDLWSYFLDVAHSVLGAAASQADYVAYAARYCSDPTRYSPTDSTTWPTHVTGGAVDLTLCRADSREALFMGGIYDDPSSVSHTAYYERRLTSASAQEARRNRRILYWSMAAEGFANYSFEWWHYDWGTQLWATHQAKGTTAFYGPAATRQDRRFSTLKP